MPAEDLIQVKTALLSVSDKTGLTEFATQLQAQGITLISTGGTARTLREAGLDITDVSEITGFPEIMDGRVKTLHPKIHGGLLAKREKEEHLAAALAHDIGLIDLVVVNLYPFAQTLASGADFDSCIENIDIGGPAMVRASAKNHRHVTIVTDPADYQEIASQIETHRAVSAQMRQKLALKAFKMTAQYDQMIADWLDQQQPDRAGSVEMPHRLVISAPHISSLRYGENPHQQAAIYSDNTQEPSVLSARQIQGKALSYNNINDTDAALRLVAEFQQPAIAIIKHANPCGVAVGQDLIQIWKQALAADPVSAFGGIVAVNQPIDEKLATLITAIFTEVVIAPDADDAAKKAFSAKPNLRLLLTGKMPNPNARNQVIKSVLGGYLVQSRDNGQISRDDLKIVTKIAPTEKQIDDMLTAWKIAKHVKSNAIVYVKDGVSAGIGAGQMSRVDSCRIAAEKARSIAEHHGWKQPQTIDSVVASDAFFPFADGLYQAIEAGARAVIQPGGSMRDDEVIAAADEAGIAMALTGMRHFNH